MKKVLFASTALVAFAGAAAADVTLTGRAEMGIFDTNAPGVGAQFFTDIDVTFTMTGETDNGLTFGASVDLDEGGAVSNATQNNTDDGGATIFISGGFGTVTMGDTDGALDWALTEAGNVGNPGSIADDETSHAGYLGSYADGVADGQILRWDYSVGDFGVAVSLNDDNGGAGADGIAGNADDDAAAEFGYAIGFKYAIDLSGTTVNLGIGYQKASFYAGNRYNNFGQGVTPAFPAGFEVEVIGVSADATFANGFSAGVTYATHDFNSGGVNVAEIDHMSIGLGYTTGAFSIHANYGKFENDAANFESAGYGFAAAYDLGGGAVIHAGYSKDDVTGTATDASRMSLGLGLSF